MIPAFFTMMKKLCAPQKYKLADYTLEERLDLLGDYLGRAAGVSLPFWTFWSERSSILSF